MPLNHPPRRGSSSEGEDEEDEGADAGLYEDYSSEEEEEDFMDAEGGRVARRGRGRGRGRGGRSGAAGGGRRQLREGERKSERARRQVGGWVGGAGAGQGRVAGGQCSLLSSWFSQGHLHRRSVMAGSCQLWAGSSRSLPIGYRDHPPTRPPQLYPHPTQVQSYD